MDSFRTRRPAANLPILLAVVTLMCGLSAGYCQVNPAHGVDISGRPGGTPGLFLESFFRNKEIYEEAFALTPPGKKTAIRAGIVSHHLLAKNLIAEFFAGIDAAKVRRIILVGPDHYRSHYRRNPIFSSVRTWRTPFGPVEPDRPFIQRLVNNHDCRLDDGMFIQEHAIYTLVPFIGKALPHVPIVPLIVRPCGHDDHFSRLGASLRHDDPGGTVLILSSDFAHGVNREQAARLDAASLRHLPQLRPSAMNRISCDCRPGLALMRGFLGKDAAGFTLVNHKTSLNFGNQDPQNVTSYISAYYLDQTDQEIKLLFVGDLMFDRYIRSIADRHGNDYILRHIAGLLREHHGVIANLEGPITDNPSMSLGSMRGEKNNCIFTFDPGVAQTLRQHHITVVNLGNNHILNFGREGLRQTRHYLEQAGVDYFGDPEVAEKRWIIKNIAGVRVGFVSHYHVLPGSAARTVQDIQQARNDADCTVVYAHWGSEYRQESENHLRELARTFIDHGADLVVASHPHVVQARESYRGKMIYYSLGNFIFDQYFSQDTRRGLAVQVRINPKNLSMNFEEISLLLEKNGQTAIKRTIN